MSEREDIAEAARIARAVLDEIGDDASELTASAATRHRLEGAAIALEIVSANDRLRDASTVGGPARSGA